MNPKFIFAAVIAISVLMIGLLPKLASSANVSTVKADQPTMALPVVTVTHFSADTPDPTATAPLPAEENPPLAERQVTSASPARNEEQSTSIAQVTLSDLPANVSVDLQNFIASVRNNQQGTLTGVYAPGLFGMPVTGQSGGDENYVSSEENILTQYSKPSQYGVTALLAHNYLNGGKLISQLQPDQVIYLVYGDGKTTQYHITGIQYYQALSPHDVRSDFRDLNGPGGAVISYNQLFDKVYTKSNQLVFQTCLEANGDLSWGRIFISADPGR
ncbi:MAG: hypothetical protein IH586_22580 [Anaerolineaceae bacterium]|nr:hypothetical protein [Anaerolineaceae bacterium]